MTAPLESVCPSQRKAEHKNTLQLTMPCDLSPQPTAALRKTVLTSGRLSQEYQSGREGVWPCHRQHLWVGKPGLKSCLCHLPRGVLGSFLASEPQVPHLYQAEWGEHLPQR